MEIIITKSVIEDKSDIAVDVLRDLCRIEVERGLLMWPDMKDRLTLSVHWKTLKISNTRS